MAVTQPVNPVDYFTRDTHPDDFTDVRNPSPRVRAEIDKNADADFVLGKKAQKLKEKLDGVPKASNGDTFVFVPRYTSPQPGRCGGRTSVGGYCGRSAGAETAHKGTGPCVQHGGVPRKHIREKKGMKLKHRYEGLNLPTIAERFKGAEDELEGLLDLSPELKMLRAVTSKRLEEFEDFHDALIDWHYQLNPHRPPKLLEFSVVLDAFEKVGRMAERIQKMNDKAFLSLAGVSALMEMAAAAAVAAAMEEIDDNDVRTKFLSSLESKWTQLQVGIDDGESSK